MWFKKLADYYLKNRDEVIEVMIAFLISCFLVLIARPLPDLFSADVRLFLTQLKISEGLTRSRLSLIGVIISVYSLLVILSLQIKGFPKFLGRLLMVVEVLIIVVIVGTLCIYYERYEFPDRLVLCLCYTYLILVLIKTVKGIRKRRFHRRLSKNQ
ncbi:MAG: hypothetical protein IJF87_11715 [Erysipelotrichaceae bacterium]|nr:hypothetical protein [Erysipelotrichaceae bacterium]